MMINNLGSFVRRMLVVVRGIGIMGIKVVAIGMVMVGFRVGMVVMQWSRLSGRKWSKCNILMYGI